MQSNSKLPARRKRGRRPGAEVPKGTGAPSLVAFFQPQHHDGLATAGKKGKKDTGRKVAETKHHDGEGATESLTASQPPVAAAPGQPRPRRNPKGRRGTGTKTQPPTGDRHQAGKHVAEEEKTPETLHGSTKKQLQTDRPASLHKPMALVQSTQAAASAACMARPGGSNQAGPPPSWP